MQQLDKPEVLARKLSHWDFQQDALSPKGRLWVAVLVLKACSWRHGRWWGVPGRTSKGTVDKWYLDLTLP